MRLMRLRGAHRIVAILAAGAIIANAQIVTANSRYGGNPDKISDRPLTVREIEERADIRWAMEEAKRWRLEDTAYCAKVTVDMTIAAYAVCLTERTNTRLLFMLRRGCVGGHGISEICEIPAP